ncbi:heavy metal-associated isoprenylated plant protein 3-like [Andrographis paniculata]|uniref:heavy metal-associated isoprenylated plant protein 3-like n=1 Tax=Andrographis paniculata TaxID=175694 RepID=UPI0021E99767|nr:heavy metal-associated isoprenylated plant protein 3-like [Andrographis paniculata]
MAQTVEKVERNGAVEKEGGGEKKTAGGGGKKEEEEPNTVVLRMDLHCEGCAKKVTRSISQLEGVVKVKADCVGKKLTVVGNVDPFWLRERVESKTRKKVELISCPQPKKTGGGDEKETKEKTEEDEKGTNGDQKLPKEAVVLKIKLHCGGCAHKIKRVILKNIDGVNSVTTDLRKDLVTVIGTMDTKQIAPYLKEKLKRGVEIVPPPNKIENNGDKKKEKEGDNVVEETKAKNGGEGEKKENKIEEGDSKKKEESNEDKKEGVEGIKSGEEGPMVGVNMNKTEYHTYNPQTYYAIPAVDNQGFVSQDDYGLSSYHHHHHHQSYSVQGPPPPPPPTYLNSYDQMFGGDENENSAGCSVM